MTPSLGLRFNALIRREGLLGTFSYAQNQRIKAATTGPNLREVLLETRFGVWGHREGREGGVDLRPLLESPLFIRLVDRFGWTLPDLDAPFPPDPLSLECPSDADLEAAIRDVEQQIEAWAQEMSLAY